MSRIAIYTGSFDPVTIGHVDIMRRALLLVDKLIVAIGRNASKATMNAPDTRQEMIASVAAEELKTDKVEAQTFSGLSVDFAKSCGAQFIIRGLRDTTDMDFESGMAGMNNKMNGEIETVFLLSRAEHSFISSTLVRQIHQMGGDISPFVPPCVLNILKRS